MLKGKYKLFFLRLLLCKFTKEHGLGKNTYVFILLHELQKTV